MKLGILHTGIRKDEKMLLEAAKILGVDAEMIDVRGRSLHYQDPFWDQYDMYLERCISTSMGFTLIQFLTLINKPVLNPFDLAHTCNSKFATSTALLTAGVPTTDAYLCFDEQQAKDAVQKLGGYPVVAKTDSGSWGRLLSKLNDDEALETVVDHKLTLGDVGGKSIYLQHYIKKPDRDIRAFVFGSELKAAIYRTTDHWITNTARGAEASKCELTDELKDLCKKTARAMGTNTVPDGGMLAIDVFEDKEKGFLINEVNFTMEFKNSEAPTGVSISSEIITYCKRYFETIS